MGQSRSISRVLCPFGCLPLILSNVLPRASLASYPPTRASNAQTSVYMELQPTVCSFHLAMPFSGAPANCNLWGERSPRETYPNNVVVWQSEGGERELVSVPVTQYCYREAVNLYVALCCPDFPLRAGLSGLPLSSFTQRLTGLLNSIQLSAVSCQFNSPAK